MHDASALSRLLGLDGTLHVDFVHSEALAGNPLGDPATRPVVVYPPPGYDPAGSRRYPALYVLHGYTGDVAAMVSSRPWETNVVQWADRLIASKRMPPVVLVLVDGFTRLGGSQYVDSIHNGAYATYTVRDVVGSRRPQLSDDRIRRRPGGLGQILGRIRSDASRARASGRLRARLPRIAATRIFVTRTSRRLRPCIGRLRRTISTSPRTSMRSNASPSAAAADYTTMEMLAYAAAYSPRSATAFDLELPFDRSTGELRDDVFSRWLAFDPAERVAGPRRAGAAAASLSRLRPARRI